jgi:hypothetical protein
MNKKNLFVLSCLLVSLFAWGSDIHAQQKAKYTVQEQAQLDSLKQHYSDMGIPEEWATRRAESIIESQKAVQTRSGAYAATPVAGSIWLDRDSITGAPSASHAHNFTPEKFVKDVFVKGGSEIADEAIRNVTLVASSFKGRSTDTWNDKGYFGPFGGDTLGWLSNERELLYFDHGDTTTTIPGWDTNPVKAFGIDKGFLLSTGAAITGWESAEGTNVSNSALGGGYTNWAVLNGGISPPANKRDPDLSPIASTTIQTFTSLEFDFRSFTDSVTFEYIFASEEFPDFANSSVNDIFGFFVSGPGLTDEWGNTGDTINIARYPNGIPVTINNSNWGNFGSYNAVSVPIGGAVSPQYHVPIYVGSSITEYDGHSIVLTAKARLQPGVWYHLKLAISNVGDGSFGSGVFLKAGSLDLGAPESHVPKPYLQTAYDSLGIQSIYADCDNTMELSFNKGTGTEIRVWSVGSGAGYVYEPELNKLFKDTVTYAITPNDSTLLVNFKVAANVEDGSQFFFFSQIPPSTQKDTSEVFDLYGMSVEAVVKYVRPTTGYSGVLDIGVDRGSPYIQRSLNGGLTWEWARDQTTGEPLPLTSSQTGYIAGLDDDFYILYREPNTCRPIDTLWILKGGTSSPEIIREIVIPGIPGAICSLEPGTHHIKSRDNLVFTVTPLLPNVTLSISTSRILVRDNEGVNVVANADGSYTVTIYSVQENLVIYASLFEIAANEAEAGAVSVWTDSDRLLIETATAGEARIYTITGALKQVAKLSAGESAAITLPKGFYLVNLHGKTYKVAVK